MAEEVNLDELQANLQEYRQQLEQVRENSGVVQMRCCVLGGAPGSPAAHRQ